jgi:hypothetical protein
MVINKIGLKILDFGVVLRHAVHALYKIIQLVLVHIMHVVKFLRT